jgi:hypothetical protein
MARCFINAFDHEAVGYIVKHRHVGKKSVILKHSIHVALIGRNTFRGDAEDFHVARSWLLETRNKPEAGGFAGAGGAKQGEEFAFGNVECHIVHGAHGAKVAADILKTDGCCHDIKIPAKLPWRESFK